MRATTEKEREREGGTRERKREKRKREEGQEASQPYVELVDLERARSYLHLDFVLRNCLHACDFIARALSYSRGDPLATAIESPGN